MGSRHEFRAAAAVDSCIKAESSPGAIICSCILHFTSFTGVLVENNNQIQPLYKVRLTYGMKLVMAPAPAPVNAS